MSKYKSPILFAAVLALSSTSVFASEKNDEAMKKLGTKAGCFTCHAIEPGAAGPNGLKPIGPAWKEIAARYKGDKKAEKVLIAEVMDGTSPYNRHWQDKTSGVAMPPTAVAISQADAKKLVRWILALK